MSQSQTAEGLNLPLRDFHQPREAKTKLLVCTRSEKRQEIAKASIIDGLYGQRLGAAAMEWAFFLQGTDPWTILRFWLE